MNESNKDKFQKINSFHSERNIIKNEQQKETYLVK